MLHSDQGNHYISRKFRRQLWCYQIDQSISRRGNCSDNSPIERFFRNVKAKWILDLGYQSFSEAKYAVADYTVGYYPQEKLHRHNRGLSPNTEQKRYWAGC